MLSAGLVLAGTLQREILATRRAGGGALKVKTQVSGKRCLLLSLGGGVVFQGTPLSMEVLFWGRNTQGKFL